MTLLDDKNNEVPSAVALRHSLRVTGISPQHSLDLLTAFKRDATQLRYRDWYDLLDYCNFSAAPVGRHVLALHDIGLSAWKASDALCNALQVINHMQDCADDYRQLDRVYLPADMLAANGASAADLAGEKSTPGLQATLQMLLVHVENLLLDGRLIAHEVSDARLKCEVSVIYVLAKRATFIGILRAWL